jgi:hypothetical protein
MSRRKDFYEIRLRGDKRGFDLISDALPFGRLWYDGPNAISNAIGYAKHRSRSHDAVIRVYDYAGNVIENAQARERVQRETELTFSLGLSEIRKCRGVHVYCGRFFGFQCSVGVSAWA